MSSDDKQKIISDLLTAQERFLVLLEQANQTILRRNADWGRGYRAMLRRLDKRKIREEKAPKRRAALERDYKEGLAGDRRVDRMAAEAVRKGFRADRQTIIEMVRRRIESLES